MTSRRVPLAFAFPMLLVQRSGPNAFIAQKRARTTPGLRISRFFDVADVIASILHHPNPATRGAMFIGAVTSCVEPLTCYLDQRRFLPKAAEQFRAGLVTGVAFTGSVNDLKVRASATRVLFFLTSKFLGSFESAVAAPTAHAHLPVSVCIKLCIRTQMH